MIFKDFRGKALRYLRNCYCLIYRDDICLGIYYVSTSEDFDSMEKVVTLTPKNGRKINIKEKDIGRYDFRSPPLGYFFDSETGFISYLERIPSRAWRVGIHTGNVNGGDVLRDYKTSLNTLEKIREGNYPDFHTAKRASEKFGRVPFSRRYAITSSGMIEYMGKKIGKVLEGKVQVENNKAADFHNRNISSLTDLRFFAIEKSTVDYEKEDF